MREREREVGRNGRRADIPEAMMQGRNRFVGCRML